MASSKKTVQKENNTGPATNRKTSKRHNKEKLLIMSVIIACVLLIMFVVIIKIAIAPTSNIFELASNPAKSTSSTNSKSLQEIATDIEENLKSLDLHYNFNTVGTDTNLDAPAFEQELQKTP